MKRIATVNRKRCVACGACMKICPKEALRVVDGCFASADESKCVGCGLCAKTCPADCIRVEERGGAHA